MMERMRGSQSAAILRTVIVVLMILAQFALIYLAVTWLVGFGVVVYYLFTLASIAVILRLAAGAGDASYRIAWIVIVALLSGFGLLLYLIWGRAPLGFRERRYVKMAFDNMYAHQPDGQEELLKLEAAHPGRARIAKHLLSNGFPAYQNTQAAYLPLGEVFFERLMEDMERAEKFIFLEYFIITPGVIWSRMYDIMKRKAAEGVKVRLLYDDGGCLFSLGPAFDRELRAQGIEVGVFGEVHRYVSDLYINYRNHQKIAVIDGNIGYVGGNNLADCYANIDSKLGHWKDTNARLCGDAVWGLTCTFLGMWDLAHHTASTDYDAYRPTATVPSEAFCLPLQDGPGNYPRNPIEDTYLQAIGTSRKTCYITTPYLVIDDVMAETLRLAAQSGVDVRLYTPKQYDHWYVHLVTRSFYGKLIQDGVRIYEYAPGFIHAKMVVSDDDLAIIGSVNMDYRSFYLHYENTVAFFGDPIVGEMKKDILGIHAVSEEITWEAWKARKWLAKASGYVLRLFATLL